MHPGYPNVITFSSWLTRSVTCLLACVKSVEETTFYNVDCLVKQEDYIIQLLLQAAYPRKCPVTQLGVLVPEPRRDNFLRGNSDAAEGPPRWLAVSGAFSNFDFSTASTRCLR